MVEPDATVEPVGPCGTDVPTEIDMSLGGRARLARTNELLDAAFDATASSGFVVDVTPSEIVIRAPFEETSGELTLDCGDAETVVTLRSHPFRWSLAAEWEPDEENGVPGGREYFALWPGVAGERAMYMFGGFAYEPSWFTPVQTLFRFDLTTHGWSSVEQTGPLPMPGGRAAWTEEGVIAYFGGAAPADTPAGLDTEPAFHRWSGDASGAQWEEFPLGDTGPGSYTGSLIYDAPRERWLSVCGADTRTLGIHCEVHAYAPGSGWAPVSAAGDPTDGTFPRGRIGFHYAFDAENERVVMFGGHLGPGNLDIAGDTWALELGGENPRWVRLFEEAPGISRRRNGAYAYDPEENRLFVWGGTPDGATSVSGLEVLVLDRGREAWAHLDVPLEVPPRASGQGFYDAPARRILWGFGNTTRAVFTDFWALEIDPVRDR